MTYKEYIDLGFKRTDMNDNVQFNKTGYYGYSLWKDITDRIAIGVCDDNLNEPKLYIKKLGKENYHIVKIPVEAVKDLLSFEVPLERFTNAC